MGQDTTHTRKGETDDGHRAPGDCIRVGHHSPHSQAPTRFSTAVPSHRLALRMSGARLTPTSLRTRARWRAGSSLDFVDRSYLRGSALIVNWRLVAQC